MWREIVAVVVVVSSFQGNKVLNSTGCAPTNNQCPHPAHSAKSEQTLQTKRTNTNVMVAERVCVHRTVAEAYPNADAVYKRTEISFVPGDFSSILNA